MPYPTATSVIVIGAGIAGLSTARLLAKHGVPTIVFEQSSRTRTQGYGITARDWAFKPLLSDLEDTPMDDFVSAVAVDKGLGGRGWIDLTLRDNSTGATLMSPEPPKPGEAEQTMFRANRSELRDWLSEEVDVRYEHRLVDIKGIAGDLTAEFENGIAVKGCMVIAADGLHSTVRNILFPQLKPAVLPVVVYHGDVYMTHEEFKTVLGPHFGLTNVLGGVGDNFNTPLTIASADTNGVHLDWTYSRAVQHGVKDPLWMPEQSVSEVPQALITELQSKTLAPPFSIVLDTERIKHDKVYNWLSRSVFIPKHNLDQAAERGIVFVGDSAHAMPIFGGEGGNHAMLDGVELSRLIRTQRNSQCPTQQDVEVIVKAFYHGAYQRGQDAVKRCRQRFSLLHRPIAQWEELAKLQAKGV